jgi:hypothetical protein
VWPGESRHTEAGGENVNTYWSKHYPENTPLIEVHVFTEGEVHLYMRGDGNASLQPHEAEQLAEDIKRAAKAARGE